MTKLPSGMKFLIFILVGTCVIGIISALHLSHRWKVYDEEQLTCQSLLNNATSRDTLTIILQDHNCLNVIK